MIDVDFTSKGTR